MDDRATIGPFSPPNIYYNTRWVNNHVRAIAGWVRENPANLPSEMTNSYGIIG